MERSRALATTLVAAVLAACAGGGADEVTAPASLHLGDRRVELTVTACNLVGGRLLEGLPEGGSEETVVAEGRAPDGDPVRVVARRGTDVVAPHRFELLEITRGEVQERLEVVVVLRGYDRELDTWTQVDPDAPGARRSVADGLFEIEGGRLSTRQATAFTPDGSRVTVAFEATCDPQLERDPGLA